MAACSYVAIYVKVSNNTRLRWSILVLFFPALSSKDVLPVLPIWTPQCAMQPVKQVCVEPEVHMEVPIMHEKIIIL